MFVVASKSGRDSVPIIKHGPLVAGSGETHRDDGADVLRVENLTVQYGALVALQHELPEVAALRDAYRRRASLMVELLQAAPGCRVVPPEGGTEVGAALDPLPPRCFTAL